MFRNLNSRLLLSYVVIVLVCLAVVGLGLLVFVRTSPLWTNAVFVRLEAAARQAMVSLQEAGPLAKLPPERLRALLTQAAEEQGVRNLVLDAEGTVRFDSQGAWEGRTLDVRAEQLEDLARARSVRGYSRGTFSAPAGSSVGGRWAFVGHGVAAPGGGQHTILFVSPQGRLLMLAWFAENLLPPLVQAGAVALVLSILLAFLVSRSVVAPLRRVAGAAEAIARGESDTRAAVSGPSEVRSLARSFNAMADQADVDRASAEAAQQSQRDFVASVSHELKTPLTSIQGFSQALLDGTASTPETIARAARVIHEEANRMRRMVDELLILARFDAGQLVMARHPVELVALVRGCAEKLAPQMEEAGVALELDVADCSGPSEHLFVSGDADRLAQVFGNLLDNAVAHTPAGGRVTVAARRIEAAHAVEVAVTDTGEGIPAEDLPRVFERFYQVDKARQHSRGAGLGLAITNEIVSAHGGTITVESVEGLGSKFTVRLPERAGSTDTTVAKRRPKGLTPLRRD